MLVLVVLLSSTLAWQKAYQDRKQEKNSVRTILQHLLHHYANSMLQKHLCAELKLYDKAKYYYYNYV